MFEKEKAVEEEEEEKGEQKSIPENPNDDPLTFKSDQTIVFVNGRFNPPHIGHIKMIERAMIYAVEHGIYNVFVLMSAKSPKHKKEGYKNPLYCASYKKPLMETVLNRLVESNRLFKQNVRPIVICYGDGNDDDRDDQEPAFYKAIDEMVEIHRRQHRSLFSLSGSKNPIHFYLLSGSDREYDLKHDLQRKFGSIDTKFYNERINRNETSPFNKMTREELGRDDVPRVPETDEMSSTYLRSLVRKQLMDRFVEAERLIGLHDDEIADLYSMVEKGIREYDESLVADRIREDRRALDGRNLIADEIIPAGASAAHRHPVEIGIVGGGCICRKRPSTRTKRGSSSNTKQKTSSTKKNNTNNNKMTRRRRRSGNRSRSRGFGGLIESWIRKSK